MSRLLAKLFLVLLLLATPTLGQAEAGATGTPATPPATPQEKPLGVSPAPLPPSPFSQQLSSQIQTLISGVQQQQQPQAETETAETEEPAPEPRANFGTQALGIVITVLELMHERATSYVVNLSDGLQLSDWVQSQIKEPRSSARWTKVGNELQATLPYALLAGIILEMLFFPLRRTARERHPTTIGGRFGVIASLFLLRAIPILLFVGIAVSLLNKPEIGKLSKFIGLNLTYALALARIVYSLLRGALAPRSPHLRIIPLETSGARQVCYWLTGYSFVFIAAYFLMDMARAVYVPAASITAFINILGLAIVLVTIGLIITKHRAITHFLRGTASKPDTQPSLLHGLRLWIAHRWPLLAISYLIIGYGIAASGIDGGLILMVRGTVITLTLLITLRLILQRIERQLWSQATPPSMKTGLFYLLIKLSLFALAALGIVSAWGMDVEGLLTSSIGQRFLGAAFSVGTTIAVLSLIYHSISAAIDRHTNQTSGFLATSRSRTILPLLRNTIYVVFVAIGILVLLSEVGINIAPLLAGAGILGVALGFGSQTLVKDFLTGLFIVVENAVAIGDIVKIGEHSGVVEAMSIRTIRLRDMEGTLHILPFSEVTKISNMAKSFAQAVIKIGVSYDTDLEKAMKVMTDVGNELRSSPTLGHNILTPIEVLGVDELGDYSITLLARLRTHAGKQWEVKRAFLLAIKQRFDKEGITIPFPTQMQIVHKDDVKAGT